jgi:hypothetical protein
MKAHLVALALLAAVVAVPASVTPAVAKQRTVIEKLPADIIDKNYVSQVKVTIADTASKKMTELEAKANEKRTQAGLAPFAGADASIPADQYATLPFAAMMPAVMRDVTRKWGLTRERGGKPIDLGVTIENIKMANAGMALLMGSADELSGEVTVIDAATQAHLGSFYVQVVNSHGGLAGLAIRGGGIREKLVEEFALESSRILTGSTKKDWKKRVKAVEQTSAAKADGLSSAGA